MKVVLFDLFGVLIQKNDNPTSTKKYHKFDTLWKQLPKFKKDYQLAVVTDESSQDVLDTIKNEIDFEKFFDHFISQAATGKSKRDGELLEIACKDLKVAPGECLFIDDNQDNCINSCMLGMQAFCWDSSMSLEAHLENLKRYLS
jgi:FMN phosphatase YigB (HAD superfamily)